MPMPDQNTAERMRHAIDDMSGQEKGLGEEFDGVLSAMDITDEHDQSVAKDFLECLRKLDRGFDAGDAAGCVILGARKEAKEALEDAGLSPQAAKALIALGVSLCGPTEEPVVVLTPDQWRTEVPERDDVDEDEGEAEGEEICASSDCGHLREEHQAEGESEEMSCSKCDCMEFMESEEE